MEHIRFGAKVRSKVQEAAKRSMFISMLVLLRKQSLVTASTAESELIKLARLFPDVRNICDNQAAIAMTSSENVTQWRRLPHSRHISIEGGHLKAAAVR
eukprot:4163242-Amphidinium_carterae.1